VPELVNAYLAGVHLNALAKRFGMHEQTVKAHLQRAGVPVRPRPKLDSTQVEEAAELYADGWSLYQLGDRFGCDASTMRRTLHRAGVTMRGRGRSDQRASTLQPGESGRGSSL
jgi:DNA-directed RNA polymerase specialized sigma24 family protein